ncbi:hypothetical protein L210DRAFT_985959 [Boletus edulis BED1]|uniref:Uncharacterized protein n=1 Tax=Boletus edulis BED1 TaxID=1328754 RepID=A0AAD4BHN0_BOLED|nr:hypothetical protein L210DRAFT_985959 [Boletus edulis BED1]
MNLVHPFERHPEEREPVASSLLGFNNMFIGLDARRGQENEHRVRAAAQVHTLVLLTGLNVPEHISRDFDSLISFTDELPVVQDLYIYRVFHQTMVLTKSLHVKVLMQTTPEQPPQLVHPHKVLNAGICHMAAARVEARVPAQSAVRVMLDFPEDFLDHTLDERSLEKIERGFKSKRTLNGSTKSGEDVPLNSGNRLVQGFKEFKSSRGFKEFKTTGEARRSFGRVDEIQGDLS